MKGSHMVSNYQLTTYEINNILKYTNAYFKAREYHLLWIVFYFELIALKLVMQKAF